jgi:endonuclease I
MLTTTHAWFPIRKLSLALALLVSITAFAQIPPGYYNSANGLNGAALKSALHQIIDGHTEYPYTSSSTDVWDILKVADRDPNDSTKVIGLYSGFSMDAAAEYNSGSGWNREHVWAKSRGNFGTSQGAGTDAHHLRAADISTNSARNNRNFDSASTQYIDGSGNYQGATNSYTSSTDWVWEPRDEVKGDVARMIFYMVVRYEGSNGEPDLELTDMLLNNTDQSPIHGKASVLMAWHLADPVSAEEISRNDVVYSYQGNRNPFIDNPQYACMIFSSYCNGSGPTPTTDDLFISEYIEGSSYNKAIELANTTGSSINMLGYSLKKQTNGAGGWGSEYALSGTLADGDVFVIAHSSAVSAITSTADVVTGSPIVTFNGNDPIGLFKNNVLIDIVGDFDGGSSNFAKDVTKVRVAGVTGPNDTYTLAEWDDYANNNFDYIGLHGSSNVGPAISDLIISEYIEGSSYNKALELANFTGADVSLSDYSLKKQTNGSGSWGSEYTLSGTLADEDVFVIAHNSATSGITAVADVTTGSGIVTFNGNDPIGLFKNGTLIDIVGTFNAGSSNFAQNTTLVRKGSVTDPNTTYTLSEWDSYAQDTDSNLGEHVVDNAKQLSIKTAFAGASLPFSVFPNPISDKLFFSEPIEGHIIILDLAGNRVLEKDMINEAEIELADLQQGYYVLLVEQHGAVYRYPIIKK